MAVVLYNRAGVDETLVGRVVEASELPAARIILVLYEKGGLMVGGVGPIQGYAAHRSVLSS